MLLDVTVLGRTVVMGEREKKKDMLAKIKNKKKF